MKSIMKKTKNQLRKPIAVILLFLIGCCLIQSVSGAVTQSNLQINLNIKGADTQEKTSFFMPFEQIILTATLTENNLPTEKVKVAFLIEGPTNASSQFTQIRNVETDSDGIAQVSFRIPMEQNESQVIGTWQVSASAATSTQIATSNTTFTVRWGVEISDVNVEPTENQSNNMTIQFSLKNLDSHAKNLNITGTIKDSNNSQIAGFNMENFLIAANSTEIITKEIHFPAETTSGQAIAEINIYSGSYAGVEIQVAEPKQALFEIKTSNNNGTGPNNQTNPQKIRDIAVLAADLNFNQTSIGALVDITTTVINNGNDTETFLVKASSDRGQIANVTVTLEASAQKELTLEWDTSNCDKGTYSITIQIDRLQGETNVGDNQKSAGTIMLDYPMAFPQATSLFIMLLVFTGIFTVTVLIFFVKRTRANLGSKSSPTILMC